ncbi:MAG: septum formation protein Maf [Flavobacteriales bacterium]|nr:septum formation protein Maf [Flavobacteriia bacterium]NCP05227.1 septum formation protein Maf [Flavobacteriales bacterium]PIV92474.1 MAG: septum formation protein Maf [Flavobacteriaceae bacterium CG17_big_fil_post_rev_8_21_14_2_50_33_15]PIY10625.1 MAG: septum formation protein Maf [Flavobacteriaceae bacterium CG_4_10_14_3_um_filter_33_47]PJB19828.1 MAG: septum formation protein Maf [Flavobacteriaceae bacterium CG_4_9_14_3_um_filter_33_16]
MLNEQLKNHQIILASGSPRRQLFFKELGLDFEIRLKPIKEDYPFRLRHFEISDYLSQLKAMPFKDELKDHDILITSDTIVWHENKALGKPINETDAVNMLKSLSNKTHDVITSVCFTTTGFQKTVNDITKVTFKNLTDEEILYYIKKCKPFDKAGAYGIQEWIGQIGVTKMEGSYFNVMGLPMHLVYNTLLKIVG